MARLLSKCQHKPRIRALRDGGEVTPTANLQSVEAARDDDEQRAFHGRTPQRTPDDGATQPPPPPPPNAADAAAPTAAAAAQHGPTGSQGDLQSAQGARIQAVNGDVARWWRPPGLLHPG